MPIIVAIREWRLQLFVSLNNLVGDTIKFIPGLLVALIALGIGWIAGRILGRLAYLVFEAIKFDELVSGGSVDKNKLESAGMTSTPTDIVGRLVFWAVFVWIGLMPAADALSFKAGGALIQRLIGFLPETLGALLVITVALFIAGLTRETITSTMALSMPGRLFPWALGWMAWGIVAIFGLGVALGVLGINTILITNGIAVLAVSLGLGLAIGLGVVARDVFLAVMADRELRERLEEGDEVILENYTGTIERLSFNTVYLKTRGGLVTIPSRLFVEKAVVIKSVSPRRAA